MGNIQVLERAFQLLEAVAEDSSRPHTLTELIQVSGLKPATTARIVKTLAQLGYLEQLGRKTGYILGRMSFELTVGCNYTLPLVEAAKPLLHNFADQTGEYICLSAMRDDQRVILHQILSSRPVQISIPIIEAETPYRSISGRVLLAGLPPEAQQEYYTKHGLPGACWPEIDSEKELRRQLAAISGKGRAERRTEELTSIAVPVNAGNGLIAALGVYLPTYRYKTEHRRTISRLLDEISRQITEELSRS